MNDMNNMNYLNLNKKISKTLDNFIYLISIMELTYFKFIPVDLMKIITFNIIIDYLLTHFSCTSKFKNIMDQTLKKYTKNININVNSDFIIKIWDKLYYDNFQLWQELWKNYVSKKHTISKHILNKDNLKNKQNELLKQNQLLKKDDGYKFYDAYMSTIKNPDVKYEMATFYVRKPKEDLSKIDHQIYHYDKLIKNLLENGLDINLINIKRCESHVFETLKPYLYLLYIKDDDFVDVCLHYDYNKKHIFKFYLSLTVDNDYYKLDINEFLKNPNGEQMGTAMHYYLKCQDYDQIGNIYTMFRNGYDVNNIDFNDVIASKNLDIIKLFIEKGAKIKDDSIMFTIPLRNCAILQYLLKNSANPNYQNSKGETPLMVAVKIGLSNRYKYETTINDVDLLLHYKADPNLKNNKNQTALDIANQFKNTNLSCFNHYINILSKK